MNDLPSTFAEMRNSFEGGVLTAEELTERTLARIERENPHLHAFVELDAERARSDARTVDALRRLGAPLGPLAGATIGVKDLIDVAGLPTRAGSLTRADAAPARDDAPVVQRLRAAGAIVIGKTHTVEYAFGGWGTNETVGAPHNPRDMARPRAPGGSSSGSGVAVAADLCVAALGSDTGGSVRLPASFCGIVGLKTTWGLIDLAGVIPLTPMLDTIGPMTHTIADAAALLGVLAPNQDGRSPDWTRRLATLALGRSSEISGMRIGIIANLGVELAADTARIFAQTRARLESLRVQVSDISLSQTLRELAAPCGDLLAIEAFRLHGRFAEAEPSKLGAPVRERMLAGRDIPAYRLMNIIEHRQEKIRELALLFERYDAILTPTTPFPAPLLAEIDEATSPGLLTRFVNYLDLAALSLPMGVTPDGLPIGMQIVVPAYREPTALEIGAALEADRGPLLRESSSRV